MTSAKELDMETVPIRKTTSVASELDSWIRELEDAHDQLVYHMGTIAQEAVLADSSGLYAAVTKVVGRLWTVQSVIRELEDMRDTAREAAA